MTLFPFEDGLSLSVTTKNGSAGWITATVSFVGTGFQGGTATLTYPNGSPTSSGLTFLANTPPDHPVSFDYEVGVGVSGTFTLSPGGYSGSATGYEFPPTTYTVTWNANGGSVSPTSNSGTSVTAPTPTRSGYTFNGWYSASSGGSLVVNAGSSYSINSDVTLYAQWTLVPNTPKVYDGSSWVRATAVKVYDGSSWTDVSSIKYYDGSSWSSLL